MMKKYVSGKVCRRFTFLTKGLHFSRWLIFYQMKNMHLIDIDEVLELTRSSWQGLPTAEVEKN